MNDPATHRCKVCGALWWKGYVHPVGLSWSLRSPTCGKCCDTVAMGDQIEPLPAAHRASGEGGSPSALRASAPEGLGDCITASLTTALNSGEPDLLVRAVAHELRCVAQYHQRATKTEVRVRADFLRKLADLLTHATQAAKKAIPSPAPQAPPPEGINARLLDALTKSHLALADLGSRIQRTADATWVVRRPHSEMPAVIAAVDEAMLLYHAVTRASGRPAAPITEIEAMEGPAG